MPRHRGIPRERATKEIARLKSERLPRSGVADGPTLWQTLKSYIAANPELRERTAADYEKWIRRDFAPQMDQPVSRLTRETILRLNRERHEKMAAADPAHKPPRGFYAWQGTLRSLRAILNWQAAQDSRPSSWHDRLALRLKTPTARELPVELETVEGRRKLIEGLKAIGTNTARACMFIAYTGFRRREGTTLTRTDMLTENVLEFRSKTRSLRVPLSRQALSLLDVNSEGRLLHVTEWQIRKPLIRIFGERKAARRRVLRRTICGDISRVLAPNSASIQQSWTCWSDIRSKG